MTQTSGWTRDVVQDVWSSIAGAYQKIPSALSRYMPKFAAEELASEKELRNGLVRLAYHQPEIRSEILALLNED